MWKLRERLNLNQEIYRRLGEILSNQRILVEILIRTKEQIMAIKLTLEQHAAAVNAFSDKIALSIAGVRQDIADLKAQLVDATTPAEVDAILAPVMANLGAQVAALKALDDENVPAIPPVPPPVEPPPEEPPL
jgi:hypothetical protein